MNEKINKLKINGERSLHFASLLQKKILNGPGELLEAPNKAEVTLRWTVILLDASLIRNRSSEQQKTPFPQDCNDYSDSCFQWN